jgi:hypothetical protein
VVFLVLLLALQVYQRQHWQWALVERQHLLLLLSQPLPLQVVEQSAH